jgi:hypothetical protein
MSSVKSAMEKHKLLCASYHTESARKYIVPKSVWREIMTKFSLQNSENLTNFRTNLVKELAELKYNHDINAYWTIDGRIYAKKSESSTKQLIRNHDDILAQTEKQRFRWRFWYPIIDGDTPWRTNWRMRHFSRILFKYNPA